jgi:tetratricopeptide (TPR) repeat protein/predicted Ser/Thr protein kinase
MHALASLPDAAPFLPGHLLSGRYRLIEPIGRAKDGEVWLADDLTLVAQVALKVTRPTSQRSRERILANVRIARQITHPGVRRVFDVGEAEGCVYYSMEFVHGEDLATVLRRAGRLPSEKVVDIGRQLCGGLQAAHAQGLLHSDLRPANVLVNDDGSVRIIDFESATDPEANSGVDAIASDYLAPEQRGGPGTVSERTDLYAVGVILYELLVGQPPLMADAGRPAPPLPSALVPDVDPALERAILRALKVNPRDRHASAAIMAASLTRSSGRVLQRVLVLAGLAVGAVAVAMVVRPSLRPGSTPPLSERDTIVVTDFLNTTGEPVFSGALKVALAVALEQSPFLRVFPDDRVRETLRLMQRPPDERITRRLGREIAQREQLKALVAGSIGRLGSNYILALEVINAETGDVMARDQVEVPVKEQVLTALGAATSRLRERLGESLASVQRFDAPLPRATTTSLEALHAYSLALEQGRAVPRAEAVPHLRRALELDPEFAMAHALLSGVYANTGRVSEAPPHSKRAFELRDRVSERERFFISWRYYIDAAQAWDKALELARSWTTTYPGEAFAFNSLGLASAAFGQHDQAVEAFREAVRLDSKFSPAHGNLAGSLIALDRFGDAKRLLREASQRGIGFISLRRMAYTLALIDQDVAAMTRELYLVRRSADQMWASIWDARTSAFSGRFQQAHEQFQRGAQAAVRANLPALAAQWTIEDAEAHAVAGQCRLAVREVPAGLQLSRDNFTLERASRALALCGEHADASRLTAELARAFAGATLTARIQIPVTAAAAALRQADAARALELLEPVRPYDHAPSAEFWPAYLRGQAYLAVGDARSAGSEFQRILEHRGAAPASPLYPLARLGAARAAALSDDRAGAREAYDALFAAWRRADANLEVLVRARAEYARLQ